MPRRRSNPWGRAQRAEQQFAAALRRLAQHIGHIAQGYDPTHPDNMSNLEAQLKAYSQILRPWATSVASRMLADVDHRNWITWKEHSDEIGRGIRQVLETAPVQSAMQQLLAEQVALITSLPVDAAERVHKLTQESLVSGERAEQIAKEIMRTGEVSKSRAMLIARTEVSRSSTTLTMVRATTIGSRGYIWRTVEDEQVRPLHKKLEGTYHAWNDPPVSGERGERSHPGCIYNCRCIAEPILPQDY